MSGNSKLLYAVVIAGGLALAQTNNNNQTNNPNQPPKPPGQITNANATPTPIANGNPGLNPDPTTRNTDETGTSKAWDKVFIQSVALRGMRQIEIARIAVDKATNPAVKEYATKVVDEQSKATGALKRIAGRESITIPGSLDSKQQAEVDSLAKLSGADFDRAYMKDQVRTHERSLRDFQREMRDGQDDNVKAFAARVLPLVQEHLQTAQNLAK